MAERPRILCLMGSSIDGRLHLSRWTDSPDGTIKEWSGAYERIHDGIEPDAWIVGRTTMAEMATGEPKPGSDAVPPRPLHIASREGPFGIALDRSGKLRFGEAAVGGDHIVVLLGRDVPDAHLAELVANGVSYVVAGDADMALAPLMETLRAELDIETLMLEGGGRTNGSFLAAGLVDELQLVISPTLDGSPSPAIVEAGDDGLKGKVTLSLLECELLNSGAVRLRYAVATP